VCIWSIPGRAARSETTTTNKARSAQDKCKGRPAMPRDGAIIFADLIGKLDVLYAIVTSAVA
jgi:hypothetical protein